MAEKFKKLYTKPLKLLTNIRLCVSKNISQHFSLLGVLRLYSSVKMLLVIEVFK